KFCFSVPEVARALKLRARGGSIPARRSRTARVDGEALRNHFGLTQSQAAYAIGVSEGTGQNWEGAPGAPQTETRRRELADMQTQFDRSIATNALQQWLISPNESFAGDAPRDWIVEGRARDVLWEFHRMQVGEPA